MRKKLLATIFAVVMCATSAVSMGAGALVMMDEDVTLYTTAFSCGGTRYSLWQKATDYFDNENLKIYADDLTKDIPSSMAYYPGSVSVFVIDGYNLHSEEEVDFFESYLEDNDIEYSVRDLKPNSSDVLVRIDIKRPEGKTKDDMYDIWIKIKEDTGFMLDWFMLDSTGYVTDVENTLPEPTLTGDANEDGTVSLADSVYIMQALSNPDDIQLTPQGMANADTDGDGVTVTDALKIQEMLIQ